MVHDNQCDAPEAFIEFAYAYKSIQHFSVLPKSDDLGLTFKNVC